MSGNWELLDDISRRLEDAGIASPDADASILVDEMVARFGEGVSNVNGFAYQAGGASRPAAPRGAAVLDAFIDLRAATAVDGQADWIACKLHVRRAGGKLSLDFEYEQPDRWKISPANLKQMSEALRPTD